ncbi:MAG: hypothetical protein SOI13_01610 [Bifidobacterium mongoliense]|jgi:hypothetical protein|uniref:hypothetical protein n=1 Tax=Bifidobacterium mongoliense TaxID=518643 RepID=UPI002F3546FA
MTVFDNLDFTEGFKTYQAQFADTVGSGLSADWVAAQSRIACRIIVNEIPGAESRWQSGLLDKETVMYVVSCMVSRVAMYSVVHSETSSAYAYTRDAPVSTPPDYSPSPSLFLKAAEKRLLSGDDSGGPIGSVSTGLARVWGG